MGSTCRTNAATYVSAQTLSSVMPTLTLHMESCSRAFRTAGNPAIQGNWHDMRRRHRQRHALSASQYDDG